MIIFYLCKLLCTVYFFDTNANENFLTNTIVPVYLINTTNNINIEYMENLDFLQIKDLKKRLIFLYTNDRIQFDKIQYIDYLNYLNKKNKGQHVLIVDNFYRNYKFKNKKDLIIGGCKQNIYRIGVYYFCSCSFDKCGIFCENFKNTGLVNLLIIICVFLLVCNSRKRIKNAFNYAQRNKEKVD
ncbi:hypothetical protein GVAV_003108 [Gurleya vavrai]